MLYNHRSDRPLRALDFGQLFAAETAVRGVLVTGDAGGGRLLRRAGVPAEKLRTLRLPLTVNAVADAVADVLSRAAIGAEAGAPGDGAGGGGSGDDGNPAEPAERPRPIIVFGCGNARGVEALELGGQLPAEIRTDQD